MLTLVFTASDSWISKTIRWFTKSTASHVMIGTQLQGVPVYLHSTIGGVQITPMSKYTDRKVAEYEIIPDLSDGLRHAYTHIGSKYDYIGLLGYAVVILAWRWFKAKIKNPLANKDAVVCSEFIIHFDHAKIIPEWRGLDPETTTPETLLKVAGSSFRALMERKT